MKKTFPTLAVVCAYTGFVLYENGFSGIHEVFDFFYPGIMTLGVAMMSDKIQPLLTANCPALSELKREDVEVLGWQEFASRAIEKLGETLELTASGKDAHFDSLACELEYINKHRPGMDVLAAVVTGD
jgi:hypothetical protein